MKKLLIFLMSVLSIFTLVACNNEKDPVTNGETPDVPTVERPLESSGFVIHYSRPEGDYSTWGLWLWVDGKDGALYEFNGEDAYGVYYKATWDEFGAGKLDNTKLGFIVRDLSDWIKDVESDRFMEFKSLDYADDGFYHIYLITGDSAVYTSADGEVNDVIIFFGFTYNEKLKQIRIAFQTNKEYSKFKITQGDKVLVSSDTIEGDSNVVRKTSKILQYSLGQDLPDLSAVVKLSVTFAETGKVLEDVADFAELYSTPVFEEKYCYTGELGAIYSPAATEFKVWSPVSSSVKLRVYESGTPENVDKNRGDNTHTEYEMTQGDKGVWSVEVEGDLGGKYYTYVVTNDKFTNAEIVDPYAKSTGVNGLRGMIVDFSKTNPLGWEDVKIHEYKSTELTVYETHIADLTSSTTWNGTRANAKKLKGFYESGTTYTSGDVTVSTGFDHIKELGVNAVQILPFFDSANNEISPSFNWGYNPLNYNAVDGSYSSNPYDGYVRIKEFKELVKAYNEAGINIIMDVVYNHVNGLEKSNFDVLMPGYYFRYNAGVASNGSGCGNETASEHYMFRKFMIDSTMFWAQEYKLGGFRFDLMALHDVETMNQLSKNLHENVSEYITVYGEPWTGGTSAMSSSSTPASQANMNLFEGYGCFNDKMRDALIKGGLSGVSEKGWITNSSNVNSSDVLNIKGGLTGLVIAGNPKLEAEKCINYVTCHDNYTLYDRIKAAGITDEVTVKKMAMLANSVVFTSQGVSFMLAGEEFLRTKGGNENSYDASYKVNELDYSLKIKHMDMFNNYQKLIEIKQNEALFSKSNAECKALKVLTNANGSVIYFDLVDEDLGLTYRIVHCNGVTSGDKSVNLEGYTLYLDTLNVENISLTASYQMQNYQTIIAYKNISE